MNKLYLLPLLLLNLLWAGPLLVQAQSKTLASVPFSYLPGKSEDGYNKRVEHKTLPLSNSEFILLSRQSADTYAVVKYNTNLKKIWEAPLALSKPETIEAFISTKDAAVVITHTEATQGKQQLYAYRITLNDGKVQEKVLLLEAPAKSRRAGVAASPDGTKLLAFRYHSNSNMQIQDISGVIYDDALAPIKEASYNLSDIPAILTADVQVNNTGEQYISLISDNMNRLTVRQYNLLNKEVKVMSVLVGGVFDGQKVYIQDSKFSLMPDNTLYGAVFTASEATGQYYSLKAVRFDFETEDMVFAEEFKFTPTYLAKINAADKSKGPKPEQLEDIYLSDLFLTPEQKLVVLAEKKYTEGGENTPYYAKELYLFGYDEYMNSTWSSVLMKNQKAPASEAFDAISYNAFVNGNTLDLLTKEELKGKNDLYLHRINVASGAATDPQPLDLNVVKDKNIAYVKEFTAWLTDKNIITVVRTAKEAKELQLSHILIK
ncbi:hypothetical protein ACFSKU_06255 [Pontibacter silvestris]|uniref:S9 family peptidase n=1 Tax=Pontibacter silvestris TaxID=2305183 RepID=A0ABW4WUP2_9BACT|nr:hypothetical protein [Pontibacter silvestris]MCC9136436.1 hypothetical protein [Pontibacter silvestris]